MVIGGTPVYPEDEARTKWCPMVQGDATCIASGCMMWRWQPLLADDAFKDAVIKARRELKQTKSDKQDDAAKHVLKNRAKYGLPPNPHLGYCGLAGEFLT